jgi:hypothetical protein
MPKIQNEISRKDAKTPSQNREASYFKILCAFAALRDEF